MRSGVSIGQPEARCNDRHHGFATQIEHACFGSKDGRSDHYSFTCQPDVLHGHEDCLRRNADQERRRFRLPGAAVDQPAVRGTFLR